MFDSENDEVFENAPETADEALAEECLDEGTEIRDTDIVFDCPHCGHNLAIDYRGAGLQINCVNCGETVLVPIPFGMKIDDLDIEPGEILKQLFATRRNLQKAELRADELDEKVQALIESRDNLMAKLQVLAVQFAELRGLCSQQSAMQVKVAESAEKIANEFSARLDEVINEEDDVAKEGSESAE